MFARAVHSHQTTSSQQKQQQKPAVQKPLDFTSNGGAKRHALDVIESTNLRKVESTTTVRSGLIAALAKKDSFVETKGQVVLDGEIFDEAAFDDIPFDDWDVPTTNGSAAVQVATETLKVKGGTQDDPMMLDDEDDYFKDCDSLDWDMQTEPVAQLHSTPPVAMAPPTQPLITHTTPPIPQQTLQNKENTFPPPAEPTVEPPQSLSKVLFPSSAPLPWSSSPVTEQAPKPPQKRSLPWVKDPNRYGAPKQPLHQYKKDKSNIKSIVRTEARGLSTMAMETSSTAVDWDVLGLTEKDVFERTRQERLQELQRKKPDEMRTGTEWIDQPVAQGPVAALAGRRRKRTEEGKALQQPSKAALNERKAIAQVFLSEEQKNVRKLVVEDRKSVFFTGSAGTGKSVLLREIITALKKANERNPECVAVTASTGLAACNVGGITLHSFAAFGLGREPVQELAKKIKKNKKGFDRWRRVRILIIDEISMVDGAMFDKLESLARTLRKDERPFGGIQLVITGDFFQLPPVPDNGREAKFTFEAESWTRCIPHTIKLTNVFRQKDQDFVTMLNEMRLGTLSDSSIHQFKQLQRPPQFDDNIEPTELFPTRREVDSANYTRMRSLPGSIHSFRAEEGGSISNIDQRTKLLENCMAPQLLELKKDAQVMLIKNMDENLVNGSLGKVIGFMSEMTYSLCETQGIDVDEALGFDAMAAGGGGDDPFGFSTLEDEEGDSESVLRKKRKIIKLRAQSAETTQLWPLVRFTTPSGLHIDRLVTREKWSFEAPDGEVMAYRRQVPLILAYAISIHKAQGQTLSRVRVDLGKVFEKGQAYVALSRATCREGLQILRFDAKKVMAHPKVAGFYRSLEQVDRSVKKVEDERKGWQAKSLEELLERDEDEEYYAYG